MSLRDLATMAKSRLQSEWARAGVIAAAANTAFGGKFDPMQFIPPSYRPDYIPPRPLTKAELESESRIAWRVVNQFFSKR